MTWDMDRRETNWAKQQIFNRLCADYLRSKTNELQNIDRWGRELNIPKKILAAVVLDFLYERSQAVQVIEHQGKTYVKLAESTVELFAEWIVKDTNAPEHPKEHRARIFRPRLARRMA